MLALLLISVLASGPTPAAGPPIAPRAHLDVAPGVLTCISIVSELHASGVCLEEGPDGLSLRIGRQVHPLPPGDDVLETLDLIFGPGLEPCSTMTFARNFEYPPLMRTDDPRVLGEVVLPSWRPGAPWEAFAGVGADGTVGGEPLAVSLDGGPVFVPLRVEVVRPPVALPAVVGR